MDLWTRDAPPSRRATTGSASSGLAFYRRIRTNLRNFSSRADLRLRRGRSALSPRDVEVDLVPGGDPPSDLLHRHRQPVGRRPAVDDDRIDGVLPQRGLPPAGVVEEIGLQATAHAGGGVEGVLTVPVLDAAAERRLGQIALAKPLVLQRLAPRRARQVECGDGQLE